MRKIVLIDRQRVILKIELQKLGYAEFHTMLIFNKSNTECGIIRPTNAFTWDHIQYLEVSYQYPVKGILSIFKLLWRPSWNFVECPKSIASVVVVVLRSYQNI